MSSYVTLAEFASYTRDQVAGVDDVVMQAALDSAEELINDFCQRSFTVAGAASARSYSPSNVRSDFLRIHDCTTVTSVTEWGTTLAAAVYQTEPIISVDWSGRNGPIEQLRRYATYWAWDYGFPRIVVTATWGWAATPNAVKEATRIIAKDILQQRNNNSGVAGFGEYGAIRVRMNPIAIDLLKPLQRQEAFGIA